MDEFFQEESESIKLSSELCVQLPPDSKLRSIFLVVDKAGSTGFTNHSYYKTSACSYVDTESC